MEREARRERGRGKRVLAEHRCEIYLDPNNDEEGSHLLYRGGRQRAGIREACTRRWAGVAARRDEKGREPGAKYAPGSGMTRARTGKRASGCGWPVRRVREREREREKVSEACDT